MAGPENMLCARCRVSSPLESGMEGWRGISRDAGKVEPLCPSCADGVDETISLAGIATIDPASPEAPMIGAFRPVREGQDLRNFIATVPFGQLWRELEIGLTLELQGTSVDSYRVTLEYDQWPGLIFTVERLPSGGARFAAPTTDASRTPRLDIYQVHRLRRMGLQEVEGGKFWAVELTAEETNARNIAQIVVQMGVFVYSLFPNWIQSVEVR